MTTMTDEGRLPALIERLLEMIRLVLQTMSPQPAAEDEDDIDWEDGEPEDRSTAA